MRNLLSKKSDLNLILTGVMVFTVAGFLLVMGLIMLDNLLLSTADTAATTTNETITSVDEKGQAVANAGLCGFHDMSIAYITNATASFPVNSTAFTYNTRTGVIYSTGAAAGIFNNSDWNATYSYKWGATEVCEATNTTLGGQGKFADYFDLMILALVITVIISLLVALLGTGRTK